MIDAVRRVHIAPPIKHYLIELTEASRHHGAVELGLSPRATLQLAAAARATRRRQRPQLREPRRRQVGRRCRALPSAHAALGTRRRDSPPPT